MPRFFIDTNDSDFYHRDEEGTEFKDRHAARDAALAALPDMARGDIPDGDRHSFIVHVRDDNDKVIYVATLTLVGEWLT